MEHGWEKVNRADYSYQSIWTISRLAGISENMKPTWKIRIKVVDLEEPTSFLDHVYLGYTQRVCKSSDDIVTNYSDMFESRISAGARENYLQELQGNLMQKQHLLGPTAWKVMQRNACKDIANLRIKRLSNCTKSQHHAPMTIKLKEEESESVGEFVLSLLPNCSQMSLHLMVSE